MQEPSFSGKKHRVIPYTVNKILLFLFSITLFKKDTGITF